MPIPAMQSITLRFVYVQVGALFAAQDGVHCIPLDWQARVIRYKELEGWINQLIAQRAIIELC